MYCRNCGAEMNDNQAICLKCGVEKDTGDSFCYNCGKEVGKNAAVCLNCGVALESKDKSKKGNNLNGKDKAMMAVICFLLGGIGVHNFMMGETKKGIFKIVVTVISCFTLGWVIPLIDFIKILCNSYVADPNKLI